MFAGLTSIADLNQQFINFTNTITNLDTMQNAATDTTTTNTISEECNEDVIMENNESIPNISLTDSIDIQALHDIKSEVIQTLNVQMSKDLENHLEHDLNNEKQKVKDLEYELEIMKEKHYKHLQFIESENNLKLKSLEDDINKLHKSYDEKSIQQQKLIDNELITPAAIGNKVKWKKLYEEECLKSSMLQLQLDSIQNKIKNMECNISDQNKWLVLYEQEESKTISLQFKLDSSLNTINILEDKSKVLGNELDYANKNIDKMKLQQIAITDEHTLKINEFNIKLNSYDEKCKTLHEDYSNQIDKLNSRCVEYENQLQINAESLKLNQAEVCHSVSQLEDLKTLLDLKEKVCSEMEQKNNILTEKLKEIMHKYAEFKSKTSNSSHNTDEQLIELKKKVQDKDSEILSLRLKLENSERTLSDLKLKLLDITERFGETQRELTKERELLEIKMNSNEHLETSYKTLEDVNLNLLQEHNENKKQLNDMTQKYLTLMSSQQEHERLYNEKIERQQRISNDAITELQTELASLHIRLKAESQSSGNLDSYKKKAQLALKKANNATNELVIENESLKQSLADASVKLLECNELLKLANESEKNWKDQFETLKINQTAIIERYEIDIKSVQENLSQTLNELQVLTEHFEIYKALNSNKLKDTFNEQMYLLPSTNVVVDAVVDDVNIEKNNNTAYDHSISKPNIETNLNSDNIITAKDSATVALITSNNKQDDYNEQQKKETTWAIATSRSNFTIRNNKSFDLISEHSYIENYNNYNNIDKLEKSSEYLLLVNELQLQAEFSKKELAQRGIDVEAARQELQYEKEEKRLLSNKIEELLAFIDRTKRLNEGPDSTINMEYLKNCIFKYMCSIDLSERKRLYPVISTILKLTSQELAQIESAFAISEQRENEFENTFSTITNTFGSFWGR